MLPDSEQRDALAPACKARGRTTPCWWLRLICKRGNFLRLFWMIFASRPSLNERARIVLDSTTRHVEERAGVSADLRKTRVYSATPGPPSPGIAELGPDVRRGDKPPAERGFLASSGTPIGTHEFVAAAAAARLGEAQRLLDEIAELPDLQSSWLL